MAASPLLSPNTTAVVTGASKGIGLEVVKSLASQGLRVVLTARDAEKGAAAAASAGTNVEFHVLDTTDDASCAALASWLDTNGGKLDILVNNAGIAYKGNTFGAEEAKNTVETNVWGSERAMRHLAPLLKRSPHGGRVVNLCSMAGKLRILKSEELRRKFDTAASVDDIRALTNAFLNGVAMGSYEQQGWPRSMYGVSKCAEAALSRVMAKQLAADNVSVAACGPGWCATDMSSHSGPKTAAQGADTPVWLALASDPMAHSGRFYSDRFEEGF